MSTQRRSATPKKNRVQAPADPLAARLNHDANAQIIPAHLRALESIYFTAMLEDTHLYPVVDRLVVMFSQGLLPVGPGRAGAILYRYWKHGHDRLTPAARDTVYARAFGLPGGDAEIRANKKFNDLWLRFVSIVGMYSSELQVLPPAQRTVTPEDVLSSGRDLAFNLSEHGLGLPWFAAQDFKPETQKIFELLSDSEIQTAFGARDPWQVIQNVATYELGLRPNVARARTRAESGVIIMRWLANRRARLIRPRMATILSHDDICEGRTAASLNKKASLFPTDCDLAAACEQWLGVTGTQEAELADSAPLPEPVVAESAVTEPDLAESRMVEFVPEVAVAEVEELEAEEPDALAEEPEDKPA